MNVTDSLFTSQLGEDGRYSPITLPVWASLLLAEIEQLFGPRDRSFTILGIEIDKTPERHPHLWFPDSGIPSGDAEGRSRHVVIRLGPNALSHPSRARWQFAHECVHLLDPWNPKVDERPTNYLEEGLATWYQNSRVPEAESHEGQYAVAENLVGSLMGELSLAVKQIRQERQVRIGEITPKVLKSFRLELSQETLRNLCRPFDVNAFTAKSRELGTSA